MASLNISAFYYSVWGQYWLSFYHLKYPHKTAASHSDSWLAPQYSVFLSAQFLSCAKRTWPLHPRGWIFSFPRPVADTMSSPSPCLMSRVSAIVVHIFTVVLWWDFRVHLTCSVISAPPSSDLGLHLLACIYSSSYLHIHLPGPAENSAAFPCKLWCYLGISASAKLWMNCMFLPEKQSRLCLKRYIQSISNNSSSLHF